MIIAWMLYAALLTLLMAGAALAAERTIAIWHGRRRFVWVAALGAAVVIPVALSTHALWTRERAVRSDVAAQETAGTPGNAARPATILAASVLRGAIAIRADRVMVAADPFARRAWAFVSGALFLFYLGAMARVRRRARRWPETRIDGETVLLAHDVGPAVVGMFAPRVVVPEWALSLDRRSRMLMLRHEDEHMCAGDPQLLTVAALALLLFPWNPALWFIVERLRLAIEIECDSRVLLDSDSSRDYGLLLLAVCAHRSASMPLAPALAEHPAHIERRILAMTAQRPRRPLAVSVVFAALSVAMLTLAYTMPRPYELGPTAFGLDSGLLTLPNVIVINGH